MTIKRVFCVPLNYSHRQEGQLDAFKQIFGYDNVYDIFDYWGLHTGGIDDDRINDLLIDRICDFQPDWVWMQLQTSGVIKAQTVEAIKRALPKTVITHWMGDLREVVPDHLAAICKVTHATLLSNTGQFEMYFKAGAPEVHYVQIGLDWNADVLGRSLMGYDRWIPPFDVPDVVFIGGYYEHMPGHRARVEVIRSLKAEGINVGVVSESSWPSDIPVIGSCHVKQQHHVWKRAKVALSINNYNGISRYFSDRQLIAMASGTPVVCHYVPGLEVDFTNFVDCIWGHTPESMVTFTKRLLENEEQRKAIGRIGRYHVMRDHSWYARIMDLLPVVEAWRDKL